MKLLQKKYIILSTLIYLYIASPIDFLYAQELSDYRGNYAAQSDLFMSRTPFNLQVTEGKVNDVPDSIMLNNPQDTINLDSIFYPTLNSDFGDLSGLDILTFEKLKARFERKSKRRTTIDAETIPDVYEIDLSSIREESKNLINLVKLNQKNSSAYMDVNLKKSNAIKSTNKSTDLNTEAMLGQAKKLLAQGNSKKASEIINNVVAQSKNDPWVFAQVGSIYEETGKRTKALSFYEKALSINPERIELMYNCAYSLYKLGKYDKAEKYLRKIIAIDPGFTLAYYNLGNIYFKKGDYYKSLDAFSQTIKLNPLSCDAYYNAALVLEIIGQKDMAVKYYSKCLELEPTDAQAKAALNRIKRTKSRPISKAK